MIMKDLSSSRSPSQIKKERHWQHIDEIISIARANLKKEKIADFLFMNVDDHRFATNEIVARYRAERLKCNTLIEVGCGIGAQTIAFAKTCKQVIAIEKDERKISYAKENCKKQKNIAFIHGDALKVVSEIKSADIVFCDPERKPEEKERSFSTIQPSITLLLEKFGGLTKNFCIELPPQMQSIPIEGELEYLSVDNKLNRLNLYTGSLARYKKNALLLPEKKRLELIDNVLPEAKNVEKYIFEINPAIKKAGLIDSLKIKDVKKVLVADNTYVTGNQFMKSSFFVHAYEFLCECASEKDLIEHLKKLDAGKVILRGKIPEDQYWKRRTTIEKQLSGSKTFTVFVGNTFLVCIQRKLFE